MAETSTRRDRDTVQSVIRALDIIETVAAGDGMSVQAIAQTLGLKRPTVHSLVQTLVARGFLNRSHDAAQFVLGRSIRRLVELHDQQSLSARAAAAMHGLRRQFPTVDFVLSRADGVYIRSTLRLAHEHPSQMQRRMQAMQHPYHTAASLVYFAFWPKEMRAEFMEVFPFGVFAPPRWTDPRQMYQAAEDVRRAGYVSMRSIDDQRDIVAAPIFEADHSIAGVLGGYAEQIPPDQRQPLIDAIQSAARALSTHPPEETGKEQS
jgi:DNA-binding IclR family transcriptional regulator